MVDSAGNQGCLGKRRVDGQDVQAEERDADARGWADGDRNGGSRIVTAGIGVPVEHGGITAATVTGSSGGDPPRVRARIATPTAGLGMGDADGEQRAKDEFLHGITSECCTVQRQQVSWASA